MREGITLGIEFAGGADIQVRFDESTDTGAVRDALGEGGIEGASVQTIEGAGSLNLEEGMTSGEAAGSSTQEFLIKVKADEGEEISATVLRVRAALSAKFGDPRTSDNATGTWEVRRQESASPSAVAELSQKGIWAVGYSVFFIFIYIVFRFSQVDYKTAIGYATGAIVALIHDVLIIFSGVVLLHKEITLPVVAAILTVIGYSINDTIVVFDRIRENHGRYRSRDLWETVNKSVNESLSRTIITSLTTVLVLACLFAMGGSVIHDFAFVLLVGITTGTYSSIFVASPFFVWTSNTLRKMTAQKAGAAAASRTPRV
ncbi:MAG: protein translocase subunit SecF [Chrysiogenetes bacterium]|nr:protein translocase subunit SecF [Chrysiogenetes bacterium]